MSTQLAALGIDVIEGYEPDQLKLNPDVFVVGNVMSRGNPLVEALLDSGKRYESGPDWLARNVLQVADRWVLGVAGTHGKTTTSSLLAWILEHAGLNPGFLIGGVPLDFDVSARLGGGRHFVIEADEYDTAFFDKRAKFVHYRPRTAILNNLEHDHADIYPDVASIQKQFHLLLRTVPGNGRLIVNADEPHLDEVLRMGCWTPSSALPAAARRRNGASPRRGDASSRASTSGAASAASAASTGTCWVATMPPMRLRRWLRRVTQASAKTLRSRRCDASAA
jgi:UDP-N-acetylmuramate: L-alanyl-gamma-D-glutamyl-meso-diaminopimelate ligase